MAHTFEAVVSMAGRELFQDAFRSYLESLSFAHMGVGGRLGGLTADEFRRDNHLISLSVAREGQSHFRVVIHSETTPVEPLILDALTEGVADFLEPFWQSLTEKDSEDKLRSLIKDLRDAFHKVLGDK